MLENTEMATTRVFVRGLPPSVSEDDFRDHFAKRYVVTDIKLLSQRRIGYVGFRTCEDAAAAVKYFNRSFLRMSKIGVELVDNVGQRLPSLVSRHTEDRPFVLVDTQVFSTT